MADVLLFHHAQGQTPGFLAFADTALLEQRVLEFLDAR
jgi:hypothetical protein